MTDYSTILQWLWFGSGFLGLIVISRNPDKIVFENNFWSAMFKTTTLVIMPASIVGGPITLIVALLLPQKRLCPYCLKVNRMEETVCVYCSKSLQLPNDQQAEEILQSNLSHRFSAEVQAVVAKGYKDVSLVSAFLMIGVFITTIILSVFVIDDKSGIFTGSGLILGFVLSWLWWSYSVPRWREWALKQPGINPDELQKAAEVATLVWPKGHFFEKTEFKTKKK
jgi:hypothetical protein